MIRNYPELGEEDVRQGLISRIKLNPCSSVKRLLLDQSVPH